MTDIVTDDNEFGKELAAAFAADEGVTENPVTPAVEANKKDDQATATPPANPANVEDKNEPATPQTQNTEEEPTTPPADPAKKPEDSTTTPQNTEAPSQQNQPQPLTEEGIRKIMNDVRYEERTSGQELQNTYKDVMESYYPDGLSNVLVDQSTGKALRTPQDVVDASGGEMSTEQAAQWLMNEQYKLDQNIQGIQRQAAQIAETTVNFRRDSMAVLQKYEPLFQAYPHLQQKTFDLMMKQVKADVNKGVILQAPDVMELYDTYLEPYQRAYEFSTQQSATNPIASTTPTTPATPGQSDRMDENNDGGATTEVDDPNDFAQQVTKELAKGI